jgi:hypothetical protein
MGFSMHDSQIVSLENDLKNDIDRVEAEKRKQEEEKAEKKKQLIKDGADMTEGNVQLNRRSWSSGALGSGLSQSERQQAIESQKSRLISLEKAFDENKDKFDKDRIDSFSVRIALLRNELALQVDAVRETESRNARLYSVQESIAHNPVTFASETVLQTKEMKSGELMSQKELEKGINEELDARKRERELLEQEKHDQERIDEYKLIFADIKQEFEKLSEELEQDKHGWEVALHSTELKNKVTTLKSEIEKNSQVTIGSFFTSKKTKYGTISKNVNELEKLKKDFVVRSAKIYNAWLDFRNRKVTGLGSVDDDKNLKTLSPYSLYNKDEKSKIGVQMTEIAKESANLAAEIEHGYEIYGKFENIDDIILSDEEKKRYELKLIEMA